MGSMRGASTTLNLTPTRLPGPKPPQPVGGLASAPSRRNRRARPRLRRSRREAAGTSWAWLYDGHACSARRKSVRGGLVRFTVLQVACSGAGGQTKAEQAQVLGTTNMSASDLHGKFDRGILGDADIYWRQFPLKLV
jgi:hypothetical protein